MQILKQDIRDRLLQVAKSHFLKFGYLKASMRSIASDTGIGVGNIYNYYKDKDALFRAVVAPVLCRFEEMLMKHHNPAKPDVTRLVSDDHYYVEKARLFDPFGHAGFDPSGKIILTL